MIRLPVAAVAACIALLLGACLKDHPLILPENGYDPAHTLRSDSLDRFETVEILLVDPDDTTRAILIFRGTLSSVDNLQPQAGGDGRTLVYLIRGWKSDRGHCFTEQVTREGSATVLLDTCVKKDTGADPKPILPEFLVHSLDMGAEKDSVDIQVRSLIDSNSATLELLTFSNPLAVQWVSPRVVVLPEGDRERGTRLRIIRNPALPGKYSALLVVTSGEGADTLSVQVTVDPPPTGQLVGKLVDWRDSLPQAGWTVGLEGDSILQVTGPEGVFDFGARPPGRYVLNFSAEGRIGSADTIEVISGKEGLPFRIHPVAPAGAFREVPISWSRGLGRVAAAAGHALVTSSEFEAKGEVAVFPLENTSAALQRFPSQGNWEGHPPEEYFESGEITADSGALYIAYPEHDRLGKVENWRGAAVALNVALPFQPSGLLRDGDALMILGRNTQGTLVLGEADASTLALRRLDTLSGQTWNGVMALDWGPRLVAFDGSWYAVDGNGPTALGRLIRIDRATRKVSGWIGLPEAGASDLAASGGLLYVTVSAPSGRSVLAYHGDLTPAGSVPLGLPSHRIVFAEAGGLAGLGLVAADEGAVHVIRPGDAKPAGRLPLPGGRRARSLAVDGAAGRILATDGEKVYIAEF